MGVFAKTDGVVRTKRAWVYPASVVGAAGLFACAAGLADVIGPAPTFVLLLLSGAAPIAGAIAWTKWPRATRGSLRADEDAVTLDGRRVVERARVRRVRVRHRKGETFVHVQLAWWKRDVDVVVSDDDEARALLEAMRCDARSAVDPFFLSVGSAGVALLRSLVIGAVFLALWCILAFRNHSVGLDWTTHGPLLAFAAVALSHWNVTATIGVDGVHFRRWTLGRRFVRYADFVDARLDGTAARLSFRDGTSLVLSFAPRWLARLWGTDEEIGSFVTRIGEGIERHRDGRAPIDVDALRRAGRDTAAWIDALRASLDARASFRSPALPPEVLLRVVEDETQPEDARAGAAIALRGALDESGRVRIRAAAAPCASPALRRALETAADEDDARVLRAVDAIGRPSA